METLKFHIDEDNLYHFTKSEVTYEYILGKKELQFSSLIKTNDPLEFTLYKHDVDCSLYDAFSDEVDDAYELSDEISLSIHKYYKLLCFSTDSLNNSNKEYSKGYQKPRMWAQYGENHYGCCLVFNKRKLQNVFNRIQENETCKVYSGRINYTNDMRALKSKRMVSALERNSYAKSIIEERVDEYFLYKYEDFKDEEEYRFVLFSQTLEKQDCFKFKYSDSLVAVILGARLNDQYHKSIIENCRTEKIPVYRMDWSNSVPRIFSIK